MTSHDDLRKLAMGTAENQAPTIAAIRSAVEFYVETWYQTKDGADATLSIEGPVAKMLTFLESANPQTVLGLLDRIEALEFANGQASARIGELEAFERDARAEIDSLRRRQGSTTEVWRERLLEQRVAQDTLDISELNQRLNAMTAARDELVEICDRNIIAPRPISEPRCQVFLGQTVTCEPFKDWARVQALREVGKVGK